ncbi:neutrophil gelatinase-associated lipocalin-like [Heterocephalus glaber]|uniref:Neutrophil gelatinase-associated lipocalin-like n=1 Tax=Heterocephalus glaber TaxID=10181 RepID=A0AAX6PDE8_HETGA|nr:neutrophil gelatinase-associated lipocalin-like [Heterocephalus glaber]XP_021117211.1 neutrophil gelatinase-associated lipocalin-like [Heterocephalus glaber]
MALGLLCLGLTLLGILQSQAQDTTPTLIPSPSLSKVPLQPDFQDDQFQGKWYIIGLAGSSFRKGRQSQYNMHRTIYKLNDDHSYNVTSTLLRGQNCDLQIRIFVPSVQPGQFTLGYLPQYVPGQSYTVRVVATNYKEFAMVFFETKFRNRVNFRTTLYGRTKELSPELKQRFVNFAKSLGLTDDNIIFPVPTEKCIDG